MPTHESTPLLPPANGNGHSHHEAKPTWAESVRFLFFSSPITTLLLTFVPFCLVAQQLGWSPAARFWLSFFAIVPLAKLLGLATEELAKKAGDFSAALLNATFGNAVELIIGYIALTQDKFDIVQISMLGSVLGNVLLVLGATFVFAAIKRPISQFDGVAAQMSSSLMTLSCITLVIPAAFYYLHKVNVSGDEGGSRLAILNRIMDPETAQALDNISLGTAWVLLVVYGFYLWQMHILESARLEQSANEPQEEEQEPEKVNMSIWASLISLALITVGTAYCAEVLVGSVEEYAENSPLSKKFISLILLPIVGNVAEHVSAIIFAWKGKMDLAMNICVGSSIQISTFVVPALVIVGRFTDHRLTLFFPSFETIVLFISTILVNSLLQDGKSNMMEGLMLLALYFVIGLASWNDY